MNDPSSALASLAIGSPLPGDAKLMEDIAPVGWCGSPTWNVGRFLTLICADMDYDKPGDWLIRKVAVDWLHAPIMDRSIEWWQDAGGLHPWVVDRAHRATTLGVRKVVVTNSLYLTLRQNLTNSLPAATFAVLDRCGIAFMLDQTDLDLTYRQIDVGLPADGTVVASLHWGDRFAPFPS